MKYVGGKPSDNVSLKKKVLKYLIRYIEIGNIKRNNALLSGNKHGNHLNTALIIKNSAPCNIFEKYCILQICYNPYLNKCTSVVINWKYRIRNIDSFKQRI